MLLLLATHPGLTAYAAHKALGAPPLQDVMDSLLELADSTGGHLRTWWPAGWNDVMLGRVSVSQLAEAVLLLLLALSLRWLIVSALRWVGRALRNQKRLQLHHRTADFLFRVLNYFFLLLGLFAALSVLDLPRHPLDWELAAWRLWLTLLLCYCALLAYRIAYALLRRMVRSWTARDLGLLDHGSLPVVRDLLRVALLILALVLIVEIWGYNATTLLAGVGIGGLAIAFAAQDTIANVFGSVIIYLDRPFKIGDWIKLGDVEGSVEEIGIRSTRVRMADKTVVMIPNKRVATDNIVNFNLMTSRRIKQVLAFDISNPPEKLDTALTLIRQTLLAEMQDKHGDSGWVDPARLKDDFWYARLTSITPTYYEITIVAFTASTDYAGFLAVQEEVLLDILRGLAEHGIRLVQQPGAVVATPTLPPTSTPPKV